MKELLQLFWTFFKIGSFTFGGGYAMVPLIEREIVARRHWINNDDFLALLTLAQSAPGPIALNTSVFIGYKCRGYWGALTATLGLTIPPLVIILVIAIYFADIRSNHYVDAAFRAMRPAVVALMIAPIIGFARGLRWWQIAVAVAACSGVFFLGLSPIYFILAGVAAGILRSLFTGNTPHKATSDKADDSHDKPSTQGGRTK